MRKIEERVVHKKDFKALFDIPHSPGALYIRGSQKAFSLLDRLPFHGLAIVGSRRPHPDSDSFLRELCQDLVRSDLIIVSGVAHGIDSIAHRYAMQNKIPTIGILGFGQNFHYSDHSLKLRHEILENDGLIVSEFAHATAATPRHFLLRNRIIAYWSQATLVIEAKARSGTLNTARWAREADRTVFAVPCRPGSTYHRGNQKLIDDFQAIPFWGAHNLGSVWLSLACSRASRS